MVLLHRDLNNNLVPVVRAAILGSILANLLLCLGACFFVGGLTRDEQEFHEVVSEVGNGLLLVAGFGLLIPSAFFASLRGSYDEKLLNDDVLHMSRITAVVLLIAFGIFVYFQTRTHHGLYDSVLEADEEKDHDRHVDLKKDKLTFTECIIALAVALTCVSMHAVFLVEEIEFIVIERGISDSFMGLILVPLVEKVAEHLTAVDEAWDNQMNFALAHVLGATIQTALFNAPLVVIVGWGLQKSMDLNFEIFNIVCLILAIFVVGNFLRDGKSNYLEGSMCILIYILIGKFSCPVVETMRRGILSDMTDTAIASWYYPNPPKNESNDGEVAVNGPEVSSEPTSAAEVTATAAAALLRMAMR